MLRAVRRTRSAMSSNTMGVCLFLIPHAVSMTGLCCMMTCPGGIAAQSTRKWKSFAARKVIPSLSRKSRHPLKYIPGAIRISSAMCYPLIWQTHFRTQR